MENSTLGITVALLSTASWALCAIIFKKLGERLEPIGMTTVKSFLSCIFLLVTILLSGINLSISNEHIIPIVLSGLIGIAIGDSLFFASLNRLSPIVLSLILFVGPDLFTGVFGYIFLGEIPSLLAICGIICVLAGLACLLFPIELKNDDNSSKTTLFGILFASLSILCTAYSMVLIKPVLSEVHTITATMYRLLCSGITLSIFGICSKKISCWKNVFLDKSYNLKFSSTILLATFGGFWLSLVAIKNCQLIIASTVMALEPLFILLFMVLFNKYKPKMREYFGVVFVIIGLILIF